MIRVDFTCDLTEEELAEMLDYDNMMEIAYLCSESGTEEELLLVRFFLSLHEANIEVIL